MEQYRTEEEQVEALRRWWNENGKSTVAVIVIALAAGLGWQAWQRESGNQRRHRRAGQSADGSNAERN